MKPEIKEKIFSTLNITMWCLLIVGLFVSLGFVEKKQDSLICKSLNINIENDDEIYFVQRDDIRELLKSKGDKIVDQAVQTINIPKIEKVINSHPSVSNAEVYMDVNGGLNINIAQRKPLIRIINGNNESYYIDTAGLLMPLSENYTAKVLLVNGKVNEPYSKRYMYSMEGVLNDPIMKDSTMLDEIFILAKYINGDPFWKAQIQQLYLNEDNEFELIPRVGDHVILLGDISDMNEKFEKLMIFYKEAMNKTGWWNNYSFVNLKYKNQIVCTRRDGVLPSYTASIKTESSKIHKESNLIQAPVQKQISKTKKKKRKSK